MTDYLTAKPKLARLTGNTGETKTRMWIKLPISYWALLEQIRTHPSKEILRDVNETMAWCIMQEAKSLGIETG